MMVDKDICIQNIYQGKIMSIWVAWYKNRPENYVLGTSAKMVEDAIRTKPKIDFYQMVKGGVMATSPDYPGLEALGDDIPSAQEELIYQIDLRREVPTWKRIAQKLHKGEFLEPFEWLALEGKQSQKG